MRPADDRAQAANARLSEVCQGRREEEWEELLQIFKLADSPVGEAIHWFESRGYGARLRVQGRDTMEGKRRKVCELWRFVPDLLASEVMYVEKEEKKGRTGTMGSCIWMQTLPNGMQTSILTFLNAEHGHFRSRDLETLARQILQCPIDADFWVLEAAKTLLQTSSQDQDLSLLSEEKQHFAAEGAEMADYHKLPEWLDGCGEGSGSMLPWLSLKQSDGFQEKAPQEINFCPSRTGELSQLDITSTEVQEFKQSALDPLRSEARGCSPRKVREEPYMEEKGTLEITEADKAVIDGSERSVDQDHEMVRKDDDGTARAILGEDLYAQALSLGEALRSSPRHGLSEEIKLARTTTKFGLFLCVARAWEVDDEVTLLLVASLLVEQDGYAWSRQVLETIILPKLLTMEKPASRILTTAVTQVGKIHPRAIVDSVVFPLICSRDGASSIQCELVNRIVKDCLPEDLILSLLQKMFLPSAENHDNLNSGIPWKWTEGTVGVVQNMLNYKVNLDEQSVACLVKALDAVVMEFSKSLKFGNLLLNLVTKQGSKLRSHKELLQQIVGKSQTFLTKSIKTKLAAI
ncbi:hypothetical protein R1sor_020165 [Riccia sorocarpa]|uniref:Fanconi Anaemia group E protein C-terminal domain-containing protein n=1 Tax=Riccia sorocarpa TaxID=122646 RepID=A0ABD3IEJ5_9MARC